MVAYSLEGSLKEIVDGDLDLLPLLQRAFSRPPERELPDAALVQAAAECVASAAGRPPANPSPLLVRWLIAHPGGPSLPLLNAAVKAVDRLRDEGLPLDDLIGRLHGAER